MTSDNDGVLITRGSARSLQRLLTRGDRRAAVDRSTAVIPNSGQRYWVRLTEDLAAAEDLEHPTVAEARILIPDPDADDTTEEPAGLVEMEGDDGLVKVVNRFTNWGGAEELVLKVEEIYGHLEPYDVDCQ